MKKLLSILLTLSLVCALCLPGASAAELTDVADFELPKPATPNYMMFHTDPENEFANDWLQVVMVADQSVVKLASEYYADSDAFYEKYGLYDFRILMQFDSSLDDTEHWIYTSEWDTDYTATYGEAAGICWIDDQLIETHTLFDLLELGTYSDHFQGLAPAISTKHHDDGTNQWDTYYYDSENHSLYIRCRYYMEWEYANDIGNRHYKLSDWSDNAIFGKNGTAIIPAEPTGYEAPVIDELFFSPPDDLNNQCYLNYYQTTPQSAWEAEIYYMLTDNGRFDGLETEISINGGEWVAYNTVNSGGNWCLSDGYRTTYQEDPVLDLDDYVQLRIRFVGSAGVSPWSNVASVNAPEAQMGDVNYDSFVDAKDALAVLKVAVGKDTFSDKQVELGDLNGDGINDAKDALAILKIAVGK